MNQYAGCYDAFYLLLHSFYCATSQCDGGGGAEKYTWDVPSGRKTLKKCWSTVYDAGPTLNQHWFNVVCLLGYSYDYRPFSQPRANAGSGVRPCRGRYLWRAQRINTKSAFILCIIPYSYILFGPVFWKMFVFHSKIHVLHTLHYTSITFLVYLSSSFK